MRSLTIKTYLGLLSVGILVAMALILFLIILPTIDKIHNREQQIMLAKKTLEERRQYRHAQGENAAPTEDVTKFIEPLNATLIGQSEELTLITQLQALAEMHHLRQALTLASTDTEHTFSIQNIGSFDNLLQYLEALEHLPYYVIVPSISLTKAPGGSNAVGSSGDLSMQFSATIYVQNR